MEAAELQISSISKQYRELLQTKEVQTAVDTYIKLLAKLAQMNHTALAIGTVQYSDCG